MSSLTAQRGEGGGKVVRQGCLDAEALAGTWMPEGDGLGVQGLSGDQIGLPGVPTGIQRIGDDRMSDRREMDPDLVRPSRLGVRATSAMRPRRSTTS
jgi:hypothetical protein